MVSKISRQLNSLPLLAKVALVLLVLAAVACVIYIFVRPRPKPSHTTKPPAAKSPPSQNGTVIPDNEIQFDFTPYLILYKSGRVKRLSGTNRVPAGDDAGTNVTSKDVVIDQKTGLAARLYMPKASLANNTNNAETDSKLPVLVFYHGGAFVIESAFSPTYHNYLNVLVSEARVVAVSVEYRLAPEHPLPTAYDDSWQALNWAINNAKSGQEAWLHDHGNLSRLFLSGDSAGGNIVNNMAMRAGKEGLAHGVKITGIALLDPYFWGRYPVGTETTDPMKRHRLEIAWSFICNGKYTIEDPVVDPMAWPAQWKELGCSRVAVTVSELDQFRERGKAYVEGLKKSDWSGEAELYETEGEDHVYFLYQLGSGKAVKEMEFLTGFLDRD